MKLLVVGGEPRSEEGRALRGVLRNLHLGTEVEVEALWLREGDGSQAWSGAARRTLVVDHLRTWAVARVVNRLGGVTAAGKLRGARLRVELRSIRPDLVLLLGGEGWDLLGRLGSAPRQVTLWVEPGLNPPRGARAVADLVLCPAPVPDEPDAQPFDPGIDTGDDRLLGIDTHLSARREDLGLVAPVLAVSGAADHPDLWADLNATLATEWPDGSVVHFGVRTDTGPVSAERFIAVPDAGTADVVLLLDADTVDRSVLSHAVGAGSYVAAWGRQPGPTVAPFVDEVLDEGDVATVVRGIRDAAGLVACSRDERMQRAFERFDHAAVAPRLLTALESGTARAPQFSEPLLVGSGV